MALTYVKSMLSSLAIFTLGIFLGAIVNSHWPCYAGRCLGAVGNPGVDFLRPVSRQDCFENNTTEARVVSSSVVKSRGIDVVMARLFKFAPPGMPYADWVAPSVEVLTHADFLHHRFSACCYHPYPPLDKSLRQVLTWPGGFFIESRV
jgi:hypothetical protein